MTPIISFFSNDDTNPFDNLNKDKASLIKAGMARSAYSDRSAINQAKKYGLDTKGTIHFIKTKQQVTSQELAKLSTLSFTCHDKTVQNMTYTHCHYKAGLTFTPINKTMDVNTLEHRFPTPYNIEANYIHKSGNVGKNAGVTLLMPLAVAVDIVTFPFQLPFATLKP